MADPAKQAADRAISKVLDGGADESLLVVSAREALDRVREVLNGLGEIPESEDDNFIRGYNAALADVRAIAFDELDEVSNG
ncbi:hypothetical protein SEA_CULVER_75 [Gordonia phage Culver]|nr:hypothetical protein SEA_CULVER_75 [Gordonia phage Culver]